jgi:hypothetical protein
MTRLPLPLLDPARTEFGFTRTVCACDRCIRYCQHLPGYLIPADLERIHQQLLGPWRPWRGKPNRGRVAPGRVSLSAPAAGWETGGDCASPPSPPSSLSDLTDLCKICSRPPFVVLMEDAIDSTCFGAFEARSEQEQKSLP